MGADRTKRDGVYLFLFFFSGALFAFGQATRYLVCGGVYKRRVWDGWHGEMRHGSGPPVERRKDGSGLGVLAKHVYTGVRQPS